MEIGGVLAVVTGGASGLGEATSLRLTKAGAKVAIFDMNEEAGQKVADSIGGHFYKVDVTSEDSVNDAFDKIASLDEVARVLVNCAGIAPPAKVIARDGTPQPLDDFAKIVNINLIGTFNVLSKFAARLHAEERVGEERGVIINAASVAAFEGQVGQSAYAASKSAVAAMALPIAREFARYGIRVNTIAPGIFMTPMLASLPQDAQDSLGQQVPFPNRLGKPSEFADLALAIINNPMLNAEVIRLDGAIRMASK